MRHRMAGRKLGVTTSHRKAMLRNMVTSLFEHEKIETTDARAKELRVVADRMVTLAKRGDLHARRQALSFIRSKSVVAKLFDELSKRYSDRPGGYVRVVKKGFRVGDGAPVSIVELVAKDDKAEPKKAKKGRLLDRLGKKKEEKPKAKKKAEASAAPAETPKPEAPKEEVKAEAPEPEKEETAAEEAAEAAPTEATTESETEPGPTETTEKAEAEEEKK